MVQARKKRAFIRWAFVCLLVAAAVFAISARPAGKERHAAGTRTSRPCTLTVAFELTSPFVPDGRASISELAFRVVFAPVVFEFDPEGDPLLGRCQLDSGKAKGVFSKFVLNDSQKGEARQTPAFLTPRPVDFTAGLGIESEPTEDDESAAASPNPPARIRMSFWTDFGASKIKWGSAIATGVLENLKTVFEVPFRDLLAGRARTIVHPYEGKYPEDKGTWKIVFAPGIRKTP
ncbi:MAG: hypothetical protein A2W03_07390 [Candidatus Aminicenantes bacterium RBG_16_63_16]|nr:MAG: hypothetical protein A2W03_07390 [Candidatus Aminicenantes bacterium RBG_16_63_16]